MEVFDELLDPFGLPVTEGLEQYVFAVLGKVPKLDRYKDMIRIVKEIVHRDRPEDEFIVDIDNFAYRVVCPYVRDTKGGMYARVAIIGKHKHKKGDTIFWISRQAYTDIKFVEYAFDLRTIIPSMRPVHPELDKYWLPVQAFAEYLFGVELHNRQLKLRSLNRWDVVLQESRRKHIKGVIQKYKIRREDLEEKHLYGYSFDKMKEQEHVQRFFKLARTGDICLLYLTRWYRIDFGGDAESFGNAKRIPFRSKRNRFRPREDERTG